MIPRIAYFYWEGPNMGRLRRASILSFKKLNPGWIVKVGGGFSERRLRERVIASDLWRYEQLAETGGAYFDTDIIFVKPLPEPWLDCDFGMSVGPCGEPVAVSHLFVSERGRALMRFIVEQARERMAKPAPMTCQALGTKLLEGICGERTSIPMLVRKMRLEFGAIPYPWLLPVSPDRIDELWTDGAAKIEPWTIGVHWYGGDRLSEELEEMAESGDRVPGLVGEVLGLIERG